TLAPHVDRAERQLNATSEPTDCQNSTAHIQFCLLRNGSGFFFVRANRHSDLVGSHVVCTFNDTLTTSHSLSLSLLRDADVKIILFLRNENRLVRLALHRHHSTSALVMRLRL